MARFEQGTLVRFNHERDGGPVHRVVSIDKDGMVELNDMGGFFAPLSDPAIRREVVAQAQIAGRLALSYEEDLR